MRDHYTSDCCGAFMSDWYMDIRRCPECKESCIAIPAETIEEADLYFGPEVGRHGVK